MIKENYKLKSPMHIFAKGPKHNINQLYLLCFAWKDHSGFFFSLFASLLYCLSVCDEHKEFKDVKLFYRFRKDDGTFPLDNEVKAFMRGQRLYEK